ncbi:type III secretion system inner membrane ring lipoprotein SctJ [Piscinibacter terrae]|nr:type III secretion inner membrane ring lipoprotein SctJ [Albitalea terrae]
MHATALPVATTPPRRRLAMLCLCLCVGLLSGCKTELFGRIDESDANAVMMVLYSEGIAASKAQVDGEFWRIEVDDKDQQRALQVARNHGVPRERFASMGDMFKKEGLVSTPTEVRMRYIFALSQELSNTLSHIDGVVSARVHPVIPVNDPLSDKIQPASAAVFIKHLPDADLQQMAPAIKNLVTRSIEGLKVENVSLTFVASRADSQTAPARPPSWLDESALWGLVLSLAACLALTWGVMGWRMWKRSGAASPRSTGAAAGRTVATRGAARQADALAMDETR